MSHQFSPSSAAFPVDTEDRVNFGITAKMYAAIHLCIPDSGVDWLDAMIRRKQRDDLAARAMQGGLAGDRSWRDVDYTLNDGYSIMENSEWP